MPCKLTFNVLLQIQERSSQFLGKYKVVHRRWQENIVCGNRNQDLERGETSGLETGSLGSRTGLFLILFGHSTIIYLKSRCLWND